MKSHNYSKFFNVYMAIIYVATWHNEEWSTKRQTFRLLVIIVFNPPNARDHFTY